MELPIAATSFPQSASTAPSTWLRRVTAFLVVRRVQISVVVFLLLIVEDLLVGIKPHDIADWHDRHSVLGLTLVLTGLGVRSWAAGTLLKRFQLTTTGLYQLIRNPLYVGSFIMMLGFCQLIDDPENVFFVLGPFLLIYLLKVRDEERILSKSFGMQWQAYAKATPRFFPRRLAGNPFAGWTLSRWKANREYKSFGSALAGLIALKLWYLA